MRVFLSKTAEPIKKPGEAQNTRGGVGSGTLDVGHERWQADIGQERHFCRASNAAEPGSFLDDRLRRGNPAPTAAHSL
jgi:hypothetical protein